MKSDEMMGEKPARIRLRRAGHKMLRLDRPVDPGAATDPKAEAVEGKGGLIDRILEAIRTNPADRRRDARHEGVEREVWVGWWTGDDFGAISGVLLNISRSGAQIVVGCRPPAKTSVWIYKDVAAGLASVRAEVVGQMPSPGGAYSVRFRFAAPCPTILCEAIVCRQDRVRKTQGLDVDKERGPAKGA